MYVCGVAWFRSNGHIMIGVLLCTYLNIKFIRSIISWESAFLLGLRYDYLLTGIIFFINIGNCARKRCYNTLLGFGSEWQKTRLTSDGNSSLYLTVVGADMYNHFRSFSMGGKW